MAAAKTYEITKPGSTTFAYKARCQTCECEWRYNAGYRDGPNALYVTCPHCLADVPHNNATTYVFPDKNKTPSKFVGPLY